MCERLHLEEASDEDILEEAAHISFSEEQCLTFIEVLVEKLNKIFGHNYRLEE